jgi:membrane-bound inhibitor of C-type lysozyme
MKTRYRLTGTSALLAIPAALLVACTGAPHSRERPPQQSDILYRCDGGLDLAVSYLLAPDGASFATFAHEGRMAVLQSRPTGSGARYVDQDEQQGLRWYTKDDEAFLTIMPADHTARERVLFSGCRAQRKP